MMLADIAPDEKVPGVGWAHLDIIAGQFGEPSA